MDLVRFAGDGGGLIDGHYAGAHSLDLMHMSTAWAWRGQHP